MRPFGHEGVNVGGRLSIETKTPDQSRSGVASSLGGHDDQERKQTEHRESGELHGRVHEIDGVEPRPDDPGSRGLDPLRDPMLLLEQSPGFLTSELSSLAGSSPRPVV
jgi:hypothetical protein